MIDLTRILVLPVTALAVAISGCTKTDSGTSSTGSTQASSSDHDHGDHDGHDHDDHDGHDHDDHDGHDHDDHDGHDHDDHDHDDDAHADDDHDHDHASASATTKTVEIGGRVLAVSISGDAKPNAELHVNISQVSGEFPAAVRLWVGSRSGEGSLKIKADRDGDDWHAHVECPAAITSDTFLWVDIQARDGNRSIKSVSIS